MTTLFPPAPLRALCSLDDLPDGPARGFGPAWGGFTGLFAVRRGDQVRVYVNACPHLGVPLDDPPHDFLTTDGQRIMCSTHGAMFEPLTGLCIAGPCKGCSLASVPVTIEDGRILVPADAGL